MSNKYILPTASDEQLQIINKLSNHNLIVDSVAGSGKTTSILHIASRYININILCLTYNAELKMETREKILKLGLKNIEAHSYHSFCVKYYSKKAYNDVGMIEFIKSNIKPLKTFGFDMIILDEAQDITPLYYELICKLLTDSICQGNNSICQIGSNLNSNLTQICLLGDRYQSIYDFNKADSRYITMANQIFKSNNLRWETINLSESFRLHLGMTNFINNVVLKTNRIKSTKPELSKPRYLICDTFSETYSKPLDEVQMYLSMGYLPSDIFILAPSIRNLRSPARILENFIKTKLRSIPIYVPTSDEEKLDIELLTNKLVFSTYHQVKGLERKVVIVFGFDHAYFEFFKKNKSHFICPNEIYVAITRTLEQMTLIHHYENHYFKFIDQTKLNIYANVINIHRLSPKLKHTKIIDVAVTDLTRHLPQDVINHCMEYIEYKRVRNKKNLLDIDLKSKQKYGYENHSEITGTAIPAAYEYMKKKSMSIYDELVKLNNTDSNIENILKSNINIDVDEFIDSVDDINSDHISNNLTNSNDKFSYDIMQMNLSSRRIDELLFMANLWSAYKSGYIYKLEQINNYNWLCQTDLDLCMNRLDSLGIQSTAKFELKCTVSKRPELLERRLNGYMDCMDLTNIYEFKCVTELSAEHFLQLAIYMYVHMINLELNPPSKNMFQRTEYKYKVKQTGIIKQSCPNNTYIVELIDSKFNNLSMDGQTKPNLKLKLKVTKSVDTVITFVTNHIGHLLSIDPNTNTANMIENYTNDIHTISDSDIVDAKLIETKFRYYLYNILSDELWEIESNLERLTIMIEFLFKHKYLNKNEISDETFLNQIKLIQSKYVSI